MNELKLDWQTYEEVVKHIYQTLGREKGVKILGHGKDCKLTGKSNVTHQIDVLTGHSDGIHEYKTAIECKYWKENVNKDIIMKIAEIIEDTGIDKGVIVSKNGYTEDAVSFAKYKNIGLVELREMSEEDWRGRPRVYDIKSTIQRPEITRIKFLPSLFNKPTVESELAQTDSIVVHLYSGERRTLDSYLQSFREELHSYPINKKIEKKNIFSNDQTNKSKDKCGAIY